MTPISNLNLIKVMASETLENQFSNLVKTERKITHDILIFLQEIDKRSHHLSLGYSSLGEYLIKKHHYSEGSAFRRISAMRMLSAVPEVKQKLIEGNLNLSQLAMAQSAVLKKQRTAKTKISNGEKRELLLKIENQSTPATQSLLMDNLDIDLQQKKAVTHGKDESVYLNLKFTKEEFKTIKECLNLLSHQAADYKSLLLLLSSKFLKSKKQNIEKQASKISEIKTQGNFVAKSDRSKNLRKKNPRSRYISAEIKKKIFIRDQFKCQFKANNNHICGSKKFLQVHHIKPFAKGGENTLENLSLRCQAHNLHEANIEGLGFRQK